MTDARLEAQEYNAQLLARVRAREAALAQLPRPVRRTRKWYDRDFSTHPTETRRGE
jgi:hypothetical protein